MQVNTVSDHVTHAVIGKHVAREAQISSSAEFFNVLSNTLYSDKKLAVIREVLCNAWDIHIQTGRTDTPVEITLSDTKLTIRDFGTGIHDDDIVAVYLTYGNSTKKLDGKQTGGFGLGSKAPWAYVDHFEVESMHDGVKTIYSMSKSSGEVAGKPSATPLVSFPTEEHGLRVSMAIESSWDASAFGKIIRTIAYFGEMNVTLNGDPLPTLAFSTAKHGFVMVRKSLLQGLSGATSMFFIRYGNVVYPLPANEKVLLGDATRVTHKVGGEGYYIRDGGYSVIFQAKPDTISVTPSRESLSMTDHTVKSVVELLNNFVEIMDSGMRDECVKTSKDLIARTWSMGRPADLLTSDNQIPGLMTRDSYGRMERKSYNADIIVDVPEAAKSYMSRSYPDYAGFKHQDTVDRLKALQESGFGNRGKIQSFLKEYLAVSKKPHRRGCYSNSDWFQRVLVAPLMKKLDEVPELAGNKLLVRAQHEDRTRSRAQRYDMGTPVVEATKLSPRPLTNYMPFLRNFVVISFNRMDLESRLGSFPIMRHWLGKTEDMFVYIVSRTAGRADIARDFFEKQGMTVVDLTKAQSWERSEVVMPAAKPAVVKPRKKGLPCVSAIVYDGISARKLAYKRILEVEDHTRIEKPEFIVQYNPRADSAQLWPGMSASGQLLIAEMYGDKGGITVNDNQTARFVAMGIPLLKDWLYAKLTPEFKANKAIHEHLAKSLDKIDPVIRNKMNNVADNLLDTMTDNENLAQIFGFGSVLKDQDMKILSLYRAVSTAGRTRYDNEVLELDKFVKDIPTNPAIDAFAVKLSGSKLLSVISSSGLCTLFSDKRCGIDNVAERKKLREGAIDLLTYAIEG